MKWFVVSLFLVVPLSACSRAESTPQKQAAPAAAAPAPVGKHFGDLMAEVGRRFERAGRAVAAGRWELANYDIGEIDEVFSQDVATAQMPEDVHIDLHPIARDFAKTVPGELRTAIEARDQAAFEAAFAKASATCNSCHEAAGRAFIQVPDKIGVPVPRLDPVGAAPAPAP